MPDHAVIGYVTGGWNRDEFTTSLVAITRRSQASYIDDVIAVRSGPNLSRGRNMVVAGFLEDHDAPWLFMADTDMQLPWDTIDRLIAAADPVARPVVGALCFTENPGGDPLPALYELTEADGQPGFARYGTWPEDTCMRVSATGAACLLIHRDVLEAVGKLSGDGAAPWFRESVIGSALVGEDLTFCLRCGVAGIPVHVHTGVRAGHMKTSMI